MGQIVCVSVSFFIAKRECSYIARTDTVKKRVRGV